MRVLLPRGCGYRKRNGLYAVSDTGPIFPKEWRCIIPTENLGMKIPAQGTKTVKNGGSRYVVDWLGLQYWENVADWIGDVEAHESTSHLMRPVDVRTGDLQLGNSFMMPVHPLGWWDDATIDNQCSFVHEVNPKHIIKEDDGSKTYLRNRNWGVLQISPYYFVDAKECKPAVIAKVPIHRFEIVEGDYEENLKMLQYLENYTTIPIIIVREHDALVNNPE